MKPLFALPALLLSTSLAIASETSSEESGFLSLIGGGYTQVTDEEIPLFVLPYFEHYCAGLIKVTPFEAGLPPPDRRR